MKNNQSTHVNEKPNLAAQIGKVYGIIHSDGYPAKDRAELRRWARGQEFPLAFHRLWLVHMNSELPTFSQADCWMILAWGLSMSSENSHNLEKPLGQALAENDFSEMRLERLLSASDDIKKDIVMNTIRILASKKAMFNWCEIAELLMTKEHEQKERIRRRIASAFYQHSTNTETEKE